MAAPIDIWANFLANHKLTPQRVPNQMILVQLCKKLSETGETPKYKPYHARLKSRELVCKIAMTNGIDLAAIKHNCKVAMSRGLLDAWNKAYQEVYGSAYGTAGAKEADRRDIMTSVRKAHPNIKL